MIISSDEIRKQIRYNFDQDKGFFSTKLYKTRAIKDKMFYGPSFTDLKADYKQAKVKTLNDFNNVVNDIRKLATNPRTIFDCDNMARKLRQTLHDIRYNQYLLEINNKDASFVPYEYAALQITIKKDVFSLNNKPVIIIHDLVVIFTEQGIAFADFMQDRVWLIDEEKPNIIGIGE